MDSPKPRKSSSSSVSSSSSEPETTYTCPKDVTDLIQNHEQLLSVFEKIKEEEFPELLYKLFESHGKTKELFDCAIKKDLFAIESPENFKLSNASVLYQLLIILIHNDFGRKYIQLALHPLAKRCVAFSAQLDENNISIEAFVQESAEEFLTNLTKNSERCPIAFQEALLLLKEAMTAKFSALSQLALPFILCNTFLRDIIEQPHAFLVKSKDIGNVDSCEPLFKQIADLVCSKSFIETSPLALSLFAKLTDATTVQHLKEVIDSNRIVDEEKLKYDAETRMHRFLKGGKLKKTIQEHIQYEEAKKRIFKILGDKEGWTKMAGSKKFKITGYNKKYEWSALYVWRIETVFKASLEKVKSILYNAEKAMKLDKRIVVAKQIPGTQIEDRRDYYYRTEPAFPVAARDVVIARYDHWNEKDAMVITFSIVHDDFPKFPKCVRAEVIVSAMIFQESEDGTETTYKTVTQTDPAGNVPLWMVNRWGDGFVEEAKKLHKEFAKM